MSPNLYCTYIITRKIQAPDRSWQTHNYNNTSQFTLSYLIIRIIFLAIMDQIQWNSGWLKQQILRPKRSDDTRARVHPKVLPLRCPQCLHSNDMEWLSDVSLLFFWGWQAWAHIIKRMIINEEWTMIPSLYCQIQILEPNLYHISSLI